MLGDNHAGHQPVALALLTWLGTDLLWPQGQFEEFILLPLIICSLLQGQAL